MIPLGRMQFGGMSVVDSGSLRSRRRCSRLFVNVMVSSLNATDERTFHRSKEVTGISH